LRRSVLFFILLLSALEVVSQELPEGVMVNTQKLKIEKNLASKTFKVLRGNLTTHPNIGSIPEILGTIITDEEHAVFTPLIPFTKDTPYTLLLNNESFTFILPEVDKPTFQVINIYPSIPEVPANILKWYIRFSQAVNPIKIYNHITFLDKEGNPIDRSILNLGAPLLSQDGTLLTVWIEPGRQKQLLGPNLELGGVFAPHKAYSLQIANTLKNKNGQSITLSQIHHFSTVSSDRTKPSLETWEIQETLLNTMQPLRIKTYDQLDYGSLLDALTIQYKGEIVEGTLEWNSKENIISFNPSNNWQKGSYTINVKETLEDLAGNNLTRLFDRPLEQLTDKTPVLELVFVID